MVTDVDEMMMEDRTTMMMDRATVPTCEEIENALTAHGIDWSHRNAAGWEMRDFAVRTAGTILQMTDTEAFYFTLGLAHDRSRTKV